MIDEARIDWEGAVDSLNMLWAYAVGGCNNDTARAGVDHARDHLMAVLALRTVPTSDDVRALVWSVMSTWPEHNVVACAKFVCPDCAVQACRDDISRALPAAEPWAFDGGAA